MAKSMYDLRATLTQIIKLLFKCYFELTLISNSFRSSSSKVSNSVKFLNICSSPNFLKKKKNQHSEACVSPILKSQLLFDALFDKDLTLGCS